MKQNFDAALKAILHHEGGFVNHPSDPGGMTNLGVTKKVWEEWDTRAGGPHVQGQVLGQDQGRRPA